MDWQSDRNIMITLTEMIEMIKAENPNGLRIGDDDSGYTQLTDDEYNKTIEQWAKSRLERLEQETVLASKRAAALAKLEALGLNVDDLKALGLGGN